MLPLCYAANKKTLLRFITECASEGRCSRSRPTHQDESDRLHVDPVEGRQDVDDADGDAHQGHQLPHHQKTGWYKLSIRPTRVP